MRLTPYHLLVFPAVPQLYQMNRDWSSSFLEHDGEAETISAKFKRTIVDKIIRVCMAMSVLINKHLLNVK